MNPSIADSANKRTALIAQRLPGAAAQGALSLEYQPEVALGENRVVALEALLRWNDTMMGQVPPVEFIAVAEANALVAGLGDWVLGQVLADLPQILDAFPGARVAVNASGVDIADPDFAVRVERQCHSATPNAAQHLEFEITETVFDCELTTVISNIERLRNLGATVAIDDFGIGASSLARLHRIPFDKVKLDRAFIEAIDQPITRAIIKAVVDWGQQFNFQVVAEGIESTEQLRMIRDLGCSHAQGYLFAPPRPLRVLSSACANWANPQDRP